jgi:hypothetical protein
MDTEVRKYRFGLGVEHRLSCSIYEAKLYSINLSSCESSVCGVLFCIKGPLNFNSCVDNFNIQLTDPTIRSVILYMHDHDHYALLKT